MSREYTLCSDASQSKLSLFILYWLVLKPLPRFLCKQLQMDLNEKSSGVECNDKQMSPSLPT